MSIDHFEATKLAVDGMVAYKAIRKPTNNNDPHGDMIEYFDILKNETDPEMKQINVSRSGLNVIRGVHVAPYHKVAFCPAGKIYDVCVDLRPNSPTFMKWDGVWLDKDTHVIIPPYCAHGVFSAEEDSCLCYYQGGCFFPHLDFAVNPMDPQVGIKWPTPINSDKYVLSEKDTNSKPVTPELIETLKYRIEHPIEDRQTNTNSDFVVVCNTSSFALPLFDVLDKQNLKGHLLCQTSLKRETLHARIVSLRPKSSVIYILQTSGKDCVEIFTEVMNAAHVCHDLGSHITFVCETSDFQCKEDLLEIISSDCKDFALFIECPTILSRSMSKANVASLLKSNESSLSKVATFIDFDEAAKQIIQWGQEKKTGVISIGNKGKLDVNLCKEFCKQNGVELNCEQGAEYTAYDGFQDANKAFEDLISKLKQ